MTDLPLLATIGFDRLSPREQGVVDELYRRYGHEWTYDMHLAVMELVHEGECEVEYSEQLGNLYLKLVDQEIAYPLGYTNTGMVLCLNNLWDVSLEATLHSIANYSPTDGIHCCNDLDECQIVARKALQAAKAAHEGSG